MEGLGPRTCEHDKNRNLSEGQFLLLRSMLLWLPEDEKSNPGDQLPMFSSGCQSIQGIHAALGETRPRSH